ncbi:VWA domain-containing protein [Wenzhouxiangella sp. XN79A]|uniref:VWA domain-containing protein n=1 Tax=Wenzhouxiangella sp. XN79A TaxID=2724193 RepID=UPI00144ACE05|nr:VWA domain-containing protein [Wenzhouxiangella sp. XN79A]NKI35198.1 VWA domain-containing protein [Wenzhouxiangella sp. XN79A]
MNRTTVVTALVAGGSMLIGIPALAVTSLVYDSEPNDAPHEAVGFSVPDDNDVVRILGELDGNDQDAYRLIVDEDQSGRRFNLRLTGRAGALTRLDLFDFTAAADGRGRIPETLTAQPVNLLTMEAADGGRTVQADALLLPAGVYVLGVSHSGGQGAYTVELVENDSSGVRVLDDGNSEDNPQRISPNGRQVVYSQGGAWFEFDLDADEAAIPYDLEYQSALGIPSTAELIGPDGASLLVLDTDGGEPIRRPGLMLAEGVYRIRTEQKTAGVQWLALPRGAPDVTDGMEREPNDTTPMTVPFGETLRGRFDESDTDWLRFTIDEAAAGRRWNLEVEGGPESGIEICLQRPALNGLQDCRRGSDGETRMYSLGFSPGEYRIRLSDRGPAGADWQLSWTELGPIRPGEEIEPNNDLRQASPLHDRGFGRGRFEGGRETDHWRFNVTGEPQLWRVQVQGDDLFELDLKTTGGETISSERGGGQSRIRLENQFLLPGEYIIAASGTESDYTLRVQPLGPPPPGMEIEPNDSLADARRMRFGQEYFGLLAEDGDTDFYRFELLGHEQVRLTLTPPADGEVRTRIVMGDDAWTVSELQRAGEPGRVETWQAFLPPGDYAVMLSAHRVSDAEYRLLLERGDPLEPIADREPNDWPGAAVPFPADGVLAGRVGATRAAQDWYLMPVVEAPTRIEWPVQSGVRFSLVTLDAPRDDRLERSREEQIVFGELQPGEAQLLKVHGNGEYRIDLSSLTAGATTGGGLPELLIELPDVPVQAFSPWAQRVDAEVVVSNPHAEVLALRLETAVSDLRASLSGLPEAVRLEAGEVLRLPVQIELPPDLVTQPDLLLSIRAHSGPASTGALATIEAALDAAPVSPAFHWSVPESLRGRFNAAATRFGAEPVASPNIRDDKLDDLLPLFDGLTRYGRWTETDLTTAREGVEGHQQPTVRLAGDAPVPVAGFLIDPTSTIQPARMLGRFEVALSLDGENFETVLAGRLDPLTEEQAFVLDEPVPARYARLIPIDAALAEVSSGRGLKLGEFKVMAAEGWRPPFERLNLADPALGGHLVWSEPWIRGSAFEASMLVADDQSPRLTLRGETQARLVLGFHEARAARIDGVTLEPMPADRRGGTLPDSVRIAVAVESPLGPWVPVTEASLGANPTTLEFDAPVWARYVRFEFGAPEGARSLNVPDRIAVHEAAGPSILAEWGQLADTGPYESTFPPAPPSLEQTPTHRSRERALALTPGDTAPGRALLEAYSSWFRFTPTGTDNRLELTLRGRPTLEGAPRLFDDGGERVDLRPLAADGTNATWEAWVEPGRTYWIEVVEPPRSVIFSWDTSGSVAAWLPTIANALMTYAETVQPGRDEVNLLPFGFGRPLLEQWQGEPYPLMRMLAAYPQETSSSDAERTLAAAAREMIERPGKKAVLLVTDAATPTDAGLWPALREGRPQVFAMKVSSEGAFAGNPYAEIDLMQDWARVRGGHFQYVTGLGDLARGFDRAVAWLKRPVDFEVEVAFETVEDPSPATIMVEAGEAGITPEARGAVEIILDASGSMLKRMGGERRIEIAKQAIRDTVENSLPDGIPLALRVYGHREAGSCRTDLEVPLAPLDKAAFLQQVDGIQAINLARTPIADSLAAVASDLADAQGRRLVILLTDGEETCDGDPAAAIEALAEQGVDVRVNIVGFAIDEEALKDEFRAWAELGGGEYLDADEAEALGGALEQSLRIPFEVIDESGDVVASGFVGEDPVEVPAGRYSVRIRAAQDRTVRDLELRPGDARVIPFQPDS